MPQSRNESEVPVQRVCLYFCRDINNIVIIVLCFALLIGKVGDGGGEGG